jgi:hypothetical protein
MFQNLYYDEVHPDRVSPEDYAGDPHVGQIVRMMTWGHYATPEKGLPPVERYYQELVDHREGAQGRYVLLNTEVDKHPGAGAQSRLYSWTSAMANVYAANAYHRPDKSYVPRETFQESGRVRAFMESAAFHRMSPKSELRAGSTRYVLASEAGILGRSYIAYSDGASEPMGVRDLEAGTYLLRWLDTVDGDTVERVIAVPAGDRAWPRPEGIGVEAALYIKRLDGVALPEPD